MSFAFFLVFVVFLVLLLFGIKLVTFVSARKIISGVVLACIIIPSFFYFKDLIVASVNSDQIAMSVYDSLYRFKHYFIDLVGDAQYRLLDAEYARNSDRIATIERLLPELDPEQAATARSELSELTNRCEIILDEQAKMLAEINKDRIEAEQYFLVRRRGMSTQQDFDSLYKIVRLQALIRNQFSRMQTARVAEVFTQFLDSLEHLDVEQSRLLVTPDLRTSITKSEVRRLRSTLPEELENGFELRRSDLANSIEVHAGKKLATLMSDDGKNWVITSVW